MRERERESERSRIVVGRITRMLLWREIPDLQVGVDGGMRYLSSPSQFRCRCRWILWLVACMKMTKGFRRCMHALAWWLDVAESKSCRCHWWLPRHCWICENEPGDAEDLAASMGFIGLVIYVKTST